MKRISTFMSVALMALSAVAQCEFTPAIFPGQAQDRTAYEVSATIAVGEFGRPTNINSQLVNLNSTDQSVVMTNNQYGDNAVFAVAPGTADVTYTENWFIGGADGGGVAGGEGGESGTSVCPSNHTIHYTVVKGTPEAYFIEGRDPITEYIVIAGAGYSQPALQMIIKEVQTVNYYPQFVETTIDAMQCTFTSSNPNVATIGRGNSLNLPWPNVIGETTITATWGGNANWNGASASYKLIVRNPLIDPEISFSASEVNAELGVPCELPTLNNPHSVTIDKYYSTNPNIAEVNEETGAVTIKAAGTADIYCESMEDDTYYRGSAHYTIHVSSIGLKVKGINVTSLNTSDVLGDGLPSVVYVPETSMLHFYGWNLDASALDLDAIIEFTNDEMPLYIRLHGPNSIINANKVIKAEGRAVLILGASTADQLTLSATNQAVQAQYFKIHQCDVQATSTSNVALQLTELAVSKNSHLMAQSANFAAIQCQSLILAEGEEGVDILTPGVTFTPGPGFSMPNKQTAHTVEIGKVPVVVPDDEVTTIDFTATDPEGNESVVFSVSENDTFNEAEGRLEIATSLTDEAVAGALENLVPGSSAWVDLLPGSLVFDIPAGAGKVRVQCMTLSGYTLQVKMEGEAVVSITQTELGWAEVTYNVPAAIHVVIYLHATSSSAPARVIARTEDAVSAGAYIQAVEIVPNNAPSAIENVAKTVEGTQKIMQNGIMYIIRDGKAYNAQGTQVK